MPFLSGCSAMWSGSQYLLGGSFVGWPVQWFRIMIITSDRMIAYCRHIWHFLLFVLSFLPIIRCFFNLWLKTMYIWHTSMVYYIIITGLSCKTCYGMFLNLLVWFIENVYLTFEKQFHLLMCLNILEYADIQCNQTHVPRDKLSKIILIKLDF